MSTMTPQRPPGLATFQEAHATGWPLLLAGSVMSLVPMLIIFMAAQRYLVRPLAAIGLAGP
jgi:multiple sugar transport system permease protein